MYHAGEVSILRLQRHPPLSSCRSGCSRPLQRPRAIRGSASPSALHLPQQSGPDEHHDLTGPKADDRPGNARHAEEGVYRMEGLRGVHRGAVGQHDEEVEEDFGGDDERGEEVGDGGDDEQEWREEVAEEALEEPDDARKG